MARGLFQPYLSVSIRHAFKAPVHFDPDLIATEGETFSSGSVATGRNRRSFCCRWPYSDQGGP
ncbi:MAG: hypothetical protein E5X53_12670 [Mesorhizobium sp.]|nr:MAG: hypothetical protein EOR73_13650 [Mesorhizobium sp.]TIP74266.1 MAG: hypothetical protein E5X55_10320 [Mesorhizobium sp.]TIQ12856.1 MAG: hypothetical protein E5X57_11180 [Mesorhizobium sp.]TIR51890.1 MAG: hypothetical protein E5X53_12670 [Mesorhizobium sp.]TJV98889.1 MAG: hypothetical protein E5X52_06565 [Mesorhizobium sp.]